MDEEKWDLCLWLSTDLEKQKRQIIILTKSENAEQRKMKKKERRIPVGKKMGPGDNTPATGSEKTTQNFQSFDEKWKTFFFCCTRVTQSIKIKWNIL